MKRCAWVRMNNPLYVAYHDTEWGVPVTDDQVLFEFMVLESAQAGLSWETILNKRIGYTRAFKHFNPKKVAAMNKSDVARLMKDDSIVKNRLKIESTITNAKLFIEIQNEFGSFANYVYGWIGRKPIQNKHKHTRDVPAVTELAKRISSDLKDRGFKFLGPTIWYAYMQAVGMVNDHTTDCFRYKQIENTIVHI